MRFLDSAPPKTPKSVTNFKFPKILYTRVIRSVTRRGAGGFVSPEKYFAPLWKNALDIIFGPLSANSSPPLVSQSGKDLSIMLATVQQ